MPMPVGIVTVIATMRSAGLSWSHDTCCVDGEIGSLSNESISQPLPSGVGRYSTAFLYQHKALSRRHPRWRRSYLQQVFGAMPRRSGSHWRPGHVVAVARLDRTGPSTRDLLNTLAAITCTRPASDPSATRGPTRRSRTPTACYQAALRVRGAARSSEITRVVLSQSSALSRSGMVTVARRYGWEGSDNQDRNPVSRHWHNCRGVIVGQAELRFWMSRRGDQALAAVVAWIGGRPRPRWRSSAARRR